MNKPFASSEFETPKVTTGPLPSSRKIFAIPEAAPDLRVPLREIIFREGAGEPNLPVYDTSGPYTDPAVAIDVNAGLPRSRIAWVQGARRRRGIPGPRRSSRKTTAMSARRMPRRPSPRITSRCAGSTATRSPSSNSPAPASSPKR